MAMAQEALAGFSGRYQTSLLAGMRKKLGLFTEEAEDASLVEEMLDLMHQHRADYTNTFCDLESAVLPETPLFRSPGFIRWQARWQARLSRQNRPANEMLRLMQKSNPGVIPRNHQVEAALDSAVEHGDYRLFEKLLAVLAAPYTRSPEQAAYKSPPPPSAQPYRTFCGT